MHQPSKVEVELIQTVIAHLAQLSSTLVHDVSEGTLRVTSVSLRSLLVEDMLPRAWKAAFGGPITFQTWSIRAASGDDVIAYCGGGPILPGIPFSAGRNATLAQVSLDLSAFCRQVRIQVGKSRISTVELIKYFANTRGGAHFDPEGRSAASQKPAFDLLRRLESGSLGGPELRVNDRNLVHHELLSVVETVLTSREVARLRGWSAV